MSRFRIAVMMILFVGCGLTPGVPPVRPGVGNLDFYHSVSGGVFAPPTHLLFLSKFVPQPFYGWWFRDSQLIASSTADDVRQIDLDPTQKLFVDYRAQNQNWFAQDEVQLFARDPIEVFFTLKDPSRDFSDQEWKDETTINLPRGVALVYPPQPVMPLDATGILDLSPTPIGYIPLIPNFWPGGVASGPGAAPNGKGSVKAVRVVNHGLCSVELPYFTGLTNSPGFLELVSDGLFDGIVALQKLDGCIDITRDFTRTLPILRQTQDEEDGQHGGFILDARFETTIHHAGATNHDVRARGWFTFRLLDGLFSIESGALERAAVTGTASDTVKTFIWNLLASPPFLRPRAGQEGKARCEYILRAKRLVAHPDAMELVWLDYPRELSNPVYPIWLIVTAGGDPQNRLANQLCKREPKPLDGPGGQHPFYLRPFTYVNRGLITAPHTGSPCF